MKTKKIWLVIPVLAFYALVMAAWPSNADEDGHAASAAMRSELRSFYTAPPVIPHEIMEQNGTSCLACHSDVMQLGDRTTVKTPHPQFTNCLQCHVMSIPAFGEFQGVESDFQGLEEPHEGSRWSEVGPPSIPHRIFLRENCLSCHHPEARNEHLRCPHPERSNCRQCHVADESIEF